MTKKTQAELDAMSTADILVHFNALATSKGRETTKRFADRASAIKRTLALQDLEGGGASAPKPKAPPPPADKPKAAPEAGKTKKAKAEPKERKMRGMRFVFPVEREIKPVREGSKRYKLMQLLSTEEGATFEQAMKHTGWSRKDCYEGIRLLHYYSGYGMSHDATTGVIKLRTK